MKRFFNFWFLGLAALVVLAGCEKDDNQITYEGGTAPTLSASRTGNIPLAFLNQDQQAITLSWTNPNYRFTTGTSSQNVNYSIEIDTVGANFTNPLKRTVNVANELSRTFTQGEFNDILLNGLELKPAMPHQVQVRVSSYIGTGAVKLTSNVLNFTVTPYAIPPKVTPPASGKLFIVGNATPGGWNNPVPVPSQELTQVSPTLYEITLPIVGGNSYLFLPVNGDWSAKYGGMGANNTNNPNGDDFKSGGGDLIAPSVSGNYKIEVNFQTGKFKLTKL